MYGMTPERELQLRENIFEMWFEFLRRSQESARDPELFGSEELYDSQIKILEESKESLKENFIKHYYISDDIRKRESEHYVLRK